MNFAYVPDRLEDVGDLGDTFVILHVTKMPHVVPTFPISMANLGENGTALLSS